MSLYLSCRTCLSRRSRGGKIISPIKMDFNEAYDDTNTCVGLAARMGNFDLLQEMIQNGSTTNNHDNRGWRPLHEAAWGGHVDCVRVLLRADDADVDALTHECTTALQLACRSGRCYSEVVKLLLTAGADPNMKEGDEWVLPLTKAIANKNVDVVKQLLDAGADPNRMDYNYGAPIHVAAEQGLMDIAKLLIEKGAEVNSMDDAGRTALHVLMFPPFVQSTLVPLMNMLIEGGCDVNARMTDGTTPLMLGVQSNLEEAVMRLLEYGADPNIMKEDGVMALHFAIEFCPDTQQSLESRNDIEDEGGYSHILKKILDLTARKFIVPYSSQPIKYSIFHLAVEWDRFNTLKMLIKTGLRPDSFLQEAASAALDEADINLFPQVPLVLSLGTEVDTPLGFLLSKPINVKRVEMAKYMIDKGSSVNAVTHHCLPPLVAAVKHQRANYDQSCPGFDIVTHLLKNGANIMHKIRKTDVLPAALHISSLFNASAFFTILQWGLPVHEIYTKETLEKLRDTYAESRYYAIYPLFPWRVISWLNVLNMFVPQLPLHTKIMFDIGRMVEDDNLTNAWNNLDKLIGSPKKLQSLCVLVVRRCIGENRGWAEMSSSLQKLSIGNSPLPQMIADRLLLKQIQKTSLYQHPPFSIMPKYSVPPESPSNHSNSSTRYYVSSPEIEGNENDGEDNAENSLGEGNSRTCNDTNNSEDEDTMKDISGSQKHNAKSAGRMSSSETDEDDDGKEETNPSGSQRKGRTKRKRSRNDS